MSAAAMWPVGAGRRQLARPANWHASMLPVKQATTFTPCVHAVARTQCAGTGGLACTVRSMRVESGAAPSAARCRCRHGHPVRSSSRCPTLWLRYLSHAPSSPRYGAESGRRQLVNSPVRVVDAASRGAHTPRGAPGVPAHPSDGCMRFPTFSVTPPGVGLSLDFGQHSPPGSHPFCRSFRHP